jgi:hypothetical protein
LKLCPKCRHLSVEFDPHQSAERCLNRHCGWVNRGGSLRVPKARSFKFSRTMEERVKGNHVRKVSA